MSLKSRTALRVAVIDSGIHAGHPHVGAVVAGASFDDTGERSDDSLDRLGHGTAVAAAIREKAPACELLAARVFDRSLESTGAALVAAIRWAAGQDVHLINLSLGTANLRHESALGAAIADAAARGALVVAAAPVPDARWLPGALDGVVAVSLDWDCPRDRYRLVGYSERRIELAASGYPRPIPGVHPERNLKGASFAVANATGLLAVALQAGAPLALSELGRALSRNPGP